MTQEGEPKKQRLTKKQKLLFKVGTGASLVLAIAAGVGEYVSKTESSDHTDPARYQINTSAALRYAQIENNFEQLPANIVVLKSEPPKDSIVEDSDIWRVNGAQIKPITGEPGTTTGEITILTDQDFTETEEKTMRGLLVRDSIGDIVTIDEIKSNKATDSIDADLLAPEDRDNEAIVVKFNTKLVGSVSDLRSLALYLEEVDNESFQAEPASFRFFELIRDPQIDQK